MIISRGVPLLRSGLLAATRKSHGQLVTSVRHSHGNWYYRTMPKGDTKLMKISEYLGAFVWWWILWHMFVDYEHIIGEYPYPDASKWTDEELGVPPDDYVPPSKQ